MRSDAWTYRAGPADSGGALMTAEILLWTWRECIRVKKAATKDVPNSRSLSAGLGITVMCCLAEAYTGSIADGTAVFCLEAGRP